MPDPLPVTGIPAVTQSLDDVHLRDPCIVPLPDQRRYLLTGTTGSTLSARMRPTEHGFLGYLSEDLRRWTGPYLLFKHTVPGSKDFWAPEIHRWQDRWVMLATIVLPGRRRGTYALIADAPWGPFRPLAQTALTPAQDVCLDGTLFVDDAGVPWLVYCHEWVQIGDGSIRAVRLAPDLSAPAAGPITLFHASAAPWTTEITACTPPVTGRVTDGPWMMRLPGGSLGLLWSSFGAHGYGLTLAQAPSLQGPWRHAPAPLYHGDGGHGMLVTTFAGEQLLALHVPNHPPHERPRLLRVRPDAAHGLAIVPDGFPARAATTA